VKKTLIFIHPHFTINGGAGTFLLEVGKRLSDKYNIIFISQKVDQKYIDSYPEISFHTTSGPTTDKFLFWLLFPYWQFKTYLLIKKFCMPESSILVSVFPSNWLVFPYKFLFKKNKLFWFCQEPSAFVQDIKWINAINSPVKRTIAKLLNPIFKKIDYYLAQIPDQIYANSKFSKNNILKTYNRDSIVIYPGVDGTIFKPISYEKKENYILTVSRLTKFKNIDILINAFSKINKPNYRLKIVGDGEELKNLQNLSKELKISNKVDFLTNVSDTEKISLYQKAKIFVSCSKNEPFGIVPVEAMACGTPVICDNSGGPKETVANNKTGKLINCNSTELTKTINNLLINQKLIQQMSYDSAQHIVDKFTWQQAKQILIKHL